MEPCARLETPYPTRKLGGKEHPSKQVDNNEAGITTSQKQLIERIRRIRSDPEFRPDGGSLVHPDSKPNRLANIVSDVVEGSGLQPGSAGSSSPIQSISETSELYPDLDPDRRFLEPQKYFTELQSIEAAVVERSALYLFEGDHKNYYHSLSPLTVIRNFHVQIKDIRSETPLESLDELAKDVSDNLNASSRMSDLNRAVELSVYASRAEAQYLLFHLLECQNLLARVARNLTALQEKDFLTANFSVPVSSSSRPEVVELVEWNPKDVLDLAHYFHLAIKGLLLDCSDRFHIDINSTVTLLDLFTSSFQKLWDGPWSSLTTEERRRPEAAAAMWRAISHGLDLAVISYCGAHVEGFDQRYLGCSLQSLSIYSTFFKDLGPGPTFQRRTLKCLDGFLEGEQVWVLHTHGPPPEPLASQPLYLRTTIEAFADVWGPVWKTNPINQPKTVIRFNAGLGFIVPWSRPVDTDPAPLHDEIHCHWTADEDAIPSANGSVPDTPYQNYLIGGVAPSVTTNADCPLSAEFKTYHMRCNGYLKPFGTRESSKYRDSETLQVQFGSFGIGTGYQRQYKRRSKVTWKAQLVEAWKMEPDRRTPEVLETWSGLEVSACSSNARRRRLLRILGSETMRNYLGNCQFEWSDEPCERAYFEALGSDNPQAFYDLYRSHKEWRKDLGRAVSWCLEKLLNTGVNGDGSLVSFRCIGPRQESMAVLDPIEHTWIPFLTDTPEKGTFAVSAEICLESHFAGGLGCRNLEQKGSTVLETALEVNPEADGPENLHQRPRRKSNGADAGPRWSVSRLEKGDLFPVGPDGYLRVEKPLAQAQLLMSWKPRSPWKFKEPREMLKQRVLKSPPSLYHWELMYRSSTPTEPISVHIMSKNPIDHARQTTSLAGTKHELDDVHSLARESPGRRHERHQLSLSARRPREPNDTARHQRSQSTSVLPSSHRLDFTT